MALDSYSGLKTTLQTWIARADLAGDADDFIDLFEGWANRNLRVPQMEKEATTTVQEYLPMPTDFLQMRDVQYQGAPIRQLEYVTPMVADKLDPYGHANFPRYYTIVGDQLRVIPPPSGADNLRMAYWGMIPALSATTTTNWLLQLYPDAYLYGSLLHGNVRIKDTDMAVAVQSGWQSVMGELQKAGRNANIGGMLRIRTA